MHITIFLKGTVVSYNCPGTNVFFTSQNRVSNIPCNTQACLSWSDWVPVPGEDCNATCGEGARRFVSACREGSRGNVSILCNGKNFLKIYNFILWLIPSFLDEFLDLSTNWFDFWSWLLRIACWPDSLLFSFQLLAVNFCLALVPC